MTAYWVATVALLVIAGILLLEILEKAQWANPKLRKKILTARGI
jgi:hypothetical protein